MEIKRDRYLNQLVSRECNGRIKVVTGIRRCGKSYLLLKLFRDHLLAEGVPEDHVIALALDDRTVKHLRDPDALLEHVLGLVRDGGMHYVLLDEIQLVPEFWDVMITLFRRENIDVYATGSNSRFLASDIDSQFRGRSDRIHLYPLSFSEFASVFNGSVDDAWDEYCMFGGMPETIGMSREEKARYLTDLVRLVYRRDIEERYSVALPDELSMIMDVLCSSVGSLTNPRRLGDTMRSRYRRVSDVTVNRYLGILEDSFLFESAKRYDVKARKDLGSPMKFYAEDVGLRNAQLGFRDLDLSHIMENIIFLELKSRGCDVKVGVVEVRRPEDGKVKSVKLEVDFLASKAFRNYYIQSALEIPGAEKMEQETRVFRRIHDSHRKILVSGGRFLHYVDEDGVLVIGVTEFLLDEDSLDL